MSKKRGDIIIKWHDKINAASCACRHCTKRGGEQQCVHQTHRHHHMSVSHAHAHTQKHFKCRVKTRRMGQADDAERDK